MGIDPDKYLGRVLFTGSHDANALAVANKRVDAATIADRIFDAAVQKKLVKARRHPRRVALRPDPGIADRVAQESSPDDLKRRSRPRS